MLWVLALACSLGNFVWPSVLLARRWLYGSWLHFLSADHVTILFRVIFQMCRVELMWRCALVLLWQPLMDVEWLVSLLPRQNRVWGSKPGTLKAQAWHTCHTTRQANEFKGLHKLCKNMFGSSKWSQHAPVGPFDP